MVINQENCKRLNIVLKHVPYLHLFIIDVIQAYVYN